MNGKILAVVLVLVPAIFGIALYFTQIYGYYQEVTDVDFIMVEGREIAVSDYTGLDATSSGLKLRGCFTVDPADFDAVTESARPTPLMTPKWFDCFDAVTLDADLKSGAAAAYLVAKDERDGMDRIVMVYPDGRAFQWRQLNDKYQE